MEILEYFTSDDRSHWISEIEKSDWGAAKFLFQLLKEDKLKDTVGETALLFLLTDGDELVSFCTLAERDEITAPELAPWIGFVYTFPQYRGKGCIRKLLDSAESVAAIAGKEFVYISTDHEGLYEKLGYEFIKVGKTDSGENSRIYRKNLTADEEEKNRRLELGGKIKEKIVAKAREGIDPVAYCGFSCNHCFLGKWCGGCKSVYNCCSFGTLFENGKCPNITCCKEKGLDGCYGCGELEACKKGFYSADNDGADDCKTQALFIRKHGKDAYLRMQTKLHEKYKFEKIQDIFGDDMEENLRMLEALSEDN